MILKTHNNTQVLVIILVVNGIPISCAVPVVGYRDVTDAGLVFGRP